MGKAADIGSIGASGDSAYEGAYLLLFPQGQRPDFSALSKAIEMTDRLSVTHTFADDIGSAIGCEVLRDGMTFDVTGLAPTEPLAVPPTRHRYGVEDDLLPTSAEPLVIKPGPHLQTASGLMPVMRTFSAIVADVAEALPSAIAVAWQPAHAVCGVPFYCSSVRSWVAGGPFPALGLAAFSEDPAGGITSEGLAWFTGQELRIANDIAKHRAAAVQLGVRLVNQLVAQGPVTETEYIMAPDGGRLALEPSRDGKIVRVRRA